jgi:hypothetical protein
MTAGSESPPDCEWEYQNLANHQDVLQRTTADVLADLRSGGLDTRTCACDTRQIHRRLFSELTPAERQYLAGHYRGEPFPCLQHYGVKVRGDERVGCPPHLVLVTMAKFTAEIARGVDKIDAMIRTLRPADQVLLPVRFACWVFEAFLRIHPYANGNGHIARFSIWAVLGRYGLWPNKWSVEPRPNDARYIPAIMRYRDGYPQELETLVLSCL